MGDASVFTAVFIAFFAGHHLGDHVLQTDRQATRKAGHGPAAARAMAGHLLTYHLCVGAALACLALIGVPLTPLGTAAALVWSIVTHGILDRRRSVRWLLRRTGAPRFAELRDDGMNGMYLADQSLHIACIFVAAILAVALP